MIANERSPEQWASYVWEAHGQAVEYIMATGERLVEAHVAMGHRGWDNWCARTLGWSKTYVSMLETVQKVFTSGKHFWHRLPASARTLYALTQLRERVGIFAFDALLESGAISPTTTREEVEVMLGKLTRAEQDKEDALAEDVLITSGVHWQIDHTDYRQWSPPSHAYMVLTDPPYDEESVEDYYDLPVLAQEWLGPKGWLGVMVGQRHLPKVLHALTSSGAMEYVWTFGLSSPSGRANGIQFLHVQNTWKPLILLRKGDNLHLRNWTGDLVSYEWETSRNVLRHKWQQDVSPFQKLIRAMCEPGTLVLDPFCGSGTTGVAALTTGRRFAGCDSDDASVRVASERLQQTEASQRADAETA